MKPSKQRQARRKQAQEVVEVCLVDLIPSSYDDTQLRDCPELLSQAWSNFEGSESLLEYIDATLQRSGLYVDKNVMEITWPTRRGQLRMFLMNDRVITLEAQFDPKRPCRWLSLFAATIANEFQLCAISDRGTIREADLCSFSARLQEHVVSLRIQSTAKH